MNSKKGQVTIFIIIAIVIAAGVIAYFMLRDSQDSSEAASSNQENIGKISSQVSGVYLNIDGYLADTIENGLEILRLQGGYIYIPRGTKTVSVETANKHVITENGIPKLIERSGRTDVPLWVGKDFLAVPSKRFMEEQLEIYVKDRLLELGFDDFRDQGIELDIGEILVSASFEDNTLVEINYPIESTLNGNSYEFEDYSFIWIKSYWDRFCLYWKY